MDRDDRLIERDNATRRNRLIVAVVICVAMGVALGSWINAAYGHGGEDGVHQSDFLPADRCGVGVSVFGFKEPVTIQIGDNAYDGHAVQSEWTAIQARHTTDIVIRPVGYEDDALEGRYQAIPDGGCVLCWGGPDGDTQLGYSTSGKCKQGDPADVAFTGSPLCTGNNLTLDAALGAAVDSTWSEGDAVLMVWEGGRWGASKLVRHETALADGPDAALAALVDAHPVPSPVADNVYLVEYGIEGKDGGLDQWRAYRVTAEDVAQPPALGARIDHTRGGVACGVHWAVPDAEATKHFEAAGFSGIRNLRVVDGYEQGQSLYNCDLMRKHARHLDANGKCLSFYQGATDWSDNTCSIFEFDYDRYSGPIGDLGRR